MNEPVRIRSPAVPASWRRSGGAKGYALTAVDGGADVICPMPALRAVGLELLIEGARVTCETAPGAGGAEVVRILAVRFPEPAHGKDEDRDEGAAEAPAAPAGRHAIARQSG